MKIIHVVIGKANPARMNGVNIVAHQMVSEMRAQGCDAEIWGLSHDTETEGQRPYPLHLFRMNPNSFILPSELKRALSSLGPDNIIHFHGVMIPAFFSIGRILKKQGICYVVTSHSALLHRSLQRGWLKKKLYIALFDRIFLRNAHKLHAITDAEAMALPRYNPHVAQISNGFKGMDTAITNPADEFILGYLGRMDARHKDLYALLDGFLDYARQYDDGVLWMIGDGPDKEKLMAHAKYHPRVIFHGPRFGDDKLALLSQISAFIHSSNWDAMPISVLEAAWQGKPLIISARTGYAPAVRKWYGGMIMPDDNIAHTIEKCREFHYSGALKTMGEQAAKMVRTDFDWSKIVPQIIAGLYST